MTAKPTIVAAFVPTREGEAALRLATEEARRHDARVVVVQSARGGVRDDDDEVVRDQDRLEALRADLEQAGVDHDVVYRVQGHDPHDDILAMAREADAQLIVIGLRRRSPVGKALFGSTAQQVLLHAPCPVLAVPADFDAVTSGWTR